MGRKGSKISAAYVAKIAQRAAAGEEVQAVLRDLAAKGYSWAEIGSALSLSPATVRSVSSRGLVGAATAQRILAWHADGCSGLPDTPKRHPAVTAFLQATGRHAASVANRVRKDTP